jgi:hypothetical protein
MTKRTLGIIASMLTVLLGADARANPMANAWEGLYGQVGFVGYESYIPVAATGTTTLPNSMVLPTTSTANHANGPAGNVTLGYNFTSGSSYVLGVAATLYPGTSRSAVSHASTALGTTVGSYDVANVFSLYLTPSYALDSGRLVYSKLGYTGAFMRASASGNLAGNFPRQSTYMDGVVMGVGYKQIFSGSFYAFGEGNFAANRARHVTVITSDSLVVNSTARANGYDVIFGVGYRY